MINIKKLKRLFAQTIVLVTISTPVNVCAGTYTFKPGDTFNRICVIKYRTLKYNYRLAFYNQIEDITKIKAGTIINVPSVEELENLSFWYTVKKDEDIYLIATMFYGDPQLATLLSEYNCLDSFILKENDKIFIPSYSQIMELKNACIGKVKENVKKRNI